MAKVVMKILQGSAVTQTDYENRMAIDKVIAKISGLTFLVQPVVCIVSDCCNVC